MINLRRCASRAVFCLTLTAASTSCVMSPEVVRTETSKAVSQQVPGLPTAWSAAGGSYQAVDWLASFKDDTLEALVREALENNKNLQAAAAGLEKAVALSTKAGSALKPSVGLTAGGTRSGDAGGDAAATSGFAVGAQVSWELDLWGRVGAGVSAAEAGALSAAADYEYARHSLAAAAAKAYFRAVAAGQQVTAAQARVAMLEKTLQIVKAKHDNGLTSQQDVSLTESDLAMARDSLAALQGSGKDALRSLEVLLGRYPNAEVDIKSELPALPPPPPAGLPSELLERRPDMVAAEQRVAAAFDRVFEAKAARLPRLSLTTDIGGASASLSKVLDPAQVAWQLGANLLAPLVDGGARRADVEIATAEQQEALAAYGQAALEAFTEVESLLSLGVTLSKRSGEIKKAFTESKNAYRIADLRYREGESELLDVFSIQSRVINAESSNIDIERLLLEQRVNLNLALGGDWP